MITIWNESTPNPDICDYCRDGCQCDSPHGLSSDKILNGDTSDPCHSCSYGCKCENTCNCICRCCWCECECENYIIDADSYNKWIADVCYVCNKECLQSIILENRERVFCNTHIGGDYQFKIKIFPTEMLIKQFGFFGPTKKIRSSLDVYIDGARIPCFFTGPVMIPMLLSKEAFWMSLTPMEVFSLRPGVKKAHGNVLIAGLGMGWMTHQILKKPEVTSVTQIEISSEIISFFGEPLRSFNKISFLEGNVWEWLPKLDLSKYDSILFDIWPKYREAKHDFKFKELKSKYRSKVWGWGFDG